MDSIQMELFGLLKVDAKGVLGITAFVAVAYGLYGFRFALVWMRRRMRRRGR